MDIPLSTIFDSWFFKQEIKILMIGLEEAGKTTILNKLKLGEVVSTVPTIGLKIEKVQYKNVSFTVWDILGQDRLKFLWKHHFQGTQAIIFVVDSSDSQQIEEVKKQFMNIMGYEQLKDLILLVLANKFDQAKMSIEEITSKLGLSSLKREWFIQSTCGLTGDGLSQGLDWMQKQFEKKKY